MVRCRGQQQRNIGQPGRSKIDRHFHWDTTRSRPFKTDGKNNELGPGGASAKMGGGVTGHRGAGKIVAPASPVVWQAERA